MGQNGILLGKASHGVLRLGGLLLLLLCGALLGDAVAVAVAAAAAVSQKVKDHDAIGSHLLNLFQS